MIFIMLPGLLTFSQEVTMKPVPDPASLSKMINKAAMQTHSIQSDFTQLKELSFLEDKVISSGKFYFRKEKMLRWEYVKPYRYVIILDNDRIKIVDEGKSSSYDAGSDRIFTGISGVMTGIINGTLLSDNQFSASYYETAQNYLAILVPLGAMMKDYLAKIEIMINKKDYTVDGLKMIELSGDYTLITFQNKELNAEIPADIFRID